MGDDTAGARRRRRAGSSAAPTSEPEPEETAPPAPEPPVSSSRSRRSRVPPPAETADSGTEEDESPTQSPRKGRSSLLFRRQDSSRKEALRSQPRQSIAVDEHTPSIFARCFASIRGMIYGSQDQYFLSRFQVAASTPLQMALYFNIAYAIVFAGINQALFFWKSTVWDLPLVVAVVSPMSFWVWALLEPIRLLLGYIGNLRERVAWLGGFWVLTVFPQTILHVYFIVGQASIGWFTLPIEIALSSIYLILLLFELVLGYGTFKRLIAKVCARASRLLAHYAHNRAHYAFSRTRLTRTFFLLLLSRRWPTSISSRSRWTRRACGCEHERAETDVGMRRRGERGVKGKLSGPCGGEPTPRHARGAARPFAVGNVNV